VEPACLAPAWFGWIDRDRTLNATLRAILLSAIAPLVLSTVAAVGAWAACRAGSEMELAGSALGLFVAGVACVVLVVPPCVAARNCGGERAMAIAAAVLPWAVTWGVIAVRTETYVSEWAGSLLVLAGLAVAAGGLTALLADARVPRAGAAALVVAAGVAWVTWPVWLTPASDQGGSIRASVWVAAGACLVGAVALGPRAGLRVLAAGGAVLILLHQGPLSLHPGLTINGQVYRQFGGWIEQSVAYHLTELNQSVPYAFPASVWPTVVWHFALGAIGISGPPARWRKRPRAHPALEVEGRP